jgi:hypothetical protein
MRATLWMGLIVLPLLSSLARAGQPGDVRNAEVLAKAQEDNPECQAVPPVHWMCTGLLAPGQPLPATRSCGVMVTLTCPTGQWRWLGRHVRNLSGQTLDIRGLEMKRVGDAPTP